MLFDIYVNLRRGVDFTWKFSMADATMQTRT